MSWILGFVGALLGALIADESRMFFGFLAGAGLGAAWRAPLASLALAVSVLIAVTAQSWGAMLHQWWNIDTYNHLLFVPFIAAWLVALKEEELAALAPQAFWPGLVLVAAALGLWGAGERAGINLLAQAGAVAALQAARWCCCDLR